MMLKTWWCRKYKKDKRKSVLENLSMEFAAVFGHDLQWQWDERFNAVLLHIDESQKDKVIQILESYFSDYWNVLCAEDLPESVQKLILHFDGMNPEQLLFSTDTRETEFAYCAWWPWKGSSKTSLRIALYLDNLPDTVRDSRTRQIKQWFGIAA